MKKETLLEETKHNELINKKLKKTFKYLSYTRRLLILTSTVGISVGITSSAVWMKNCAVTAGTKTYKSIIKKKKKKHDKIVLLG